MTDTLLRETLDRIAGSGRKVKLWLRDDDAVEPTPALDRLLDLTGAHGVPVTLAVIPEQTGTALAARLDAAPHALVAVHGWSHRNYAPAGEKKQELGAHRGEDVVLAELKAGFAKLESLHAPRFNAMLVPPWNRIAASLPPRLGALGFTALSTFGKEKEGASIPLINTHVDVMDWHGTRGGRPAADLFAELAGWIARPDAPPQIGVLTHHLVHDPAVWAFLESLFTLTADHPACAWVKPGAA